MRAGHAKRAPPEPTRLDLPTVEQLMQPVWPDRIPTFLDVPIAQKEAREFQDKDSPFQNYYGYREPRLKDDRSEEKKLKELNEYVTDNKKGVQEDLDRLPLFESGLGKVRRALANIPTYMILDDHDVTDDYNLNPMWYDRVYTTSLGVTTIRNALVAYALFQDWGNDPLKYEKDDYKRLLATHREAVSGPDDARSRSHRRQRHRRDARVRAARGGRRRRQRIGGEPAHHLAFLGARPEAPRRRDRQPHTAQLPLAQRTAGQRRGEPRSHRAHGADRADPRRPVHRREGGADRHRAAAGTGGAHSRRVRRARGVSRVRREGLHGQAAARPALRHTRHDGHQPRRHRSVGLRSEDARGIARGASNRFAASCSCPATCTTAPAT